MPLVLRPLLLLGCLCWLLLASPRARVHGELPSLAHLSIGRPASSARFPAAAQAWRFCPDTELLPCNPPPPDASVCLSAAELQAAFERAPNVHASLYARYDLELVMETQADDSSEMLDHVLRLLFVEVGGYSVRHVWNPRFREQTARCLAGQFDFHSEAWKTDWSDEEWQEAFFGPTHAAHCKIIGVNGLMGQNSWYADTLTVQSKAAAAPRGVQPVALDFWRAYRTDEGVAGLPRFDVDAMRNGSLGHGVWFVPPQCNVTGALCGVAYVINHEFEEGVPQQQVVNLGLQLALLFPTTATGEPNLEYFFQLVEARVDAGLQVLFMSGNLMTFVATPAFTRVELPRSNKRCLEESSAGRDGGGVGGMDCDFRPQSLYKIARVDVDADSDLADALHVFTVAQFDHDDMVDLLGFVNRGVAVPDAACEWVRNNTAIWSGWFRETTPRKYTVLLDEESEVAMYATLALFAVVSIAVHIFLLLHRKHPVIRRSSHLFNQTIVAGSLLFYATMVVAIQKDESEATCVASQVMLSLSFSAFYGALLAKTYRIYWIFHSKHLQLLKLPDSRMFAYLGAYALLDMFVVMLWALIDAPTATLVSHSTKQYAYVYQCSSDLTPVFRALTYLVRGVALLCGAFLAVRIRGVADAYNESRFLALITYNVVVVTALVAGVGLIGTNAPAVITGSWMAAVSLAVFLSLMVFIVPKAWGIYQDPTGKTEPLTNRSPPAVGAATGSGTSGGGRSGGAGGGGGGGGGSTTVARGRVVPFSDDASTLHGSAPSSLPQVHAAAMRSRPPPGPSSSAGGSSSSSLGLSRMPYPTARSTRSGLRTAAGEHRRVTSTPNHGAPAVPPSPSLVARPPPPDGPMPAGLGSPSHVLSDAEVELDIGSPHTPPPPPPPVANGHSERAL